MSEYIFETVQRCRVCWRVFHVFPGNRSLPLHIHTHTLAWDWFFFYFTLQSLFFSSHFSHVGLLCVVFLRRRKKKWVLKRRKKNDRLESLHVCCFIRMRWNKRIEDCLLGKYQYLCAWCRERRGETTGKKLYLFLKHQIPKKNKIFFCNILEGAIYDDLSACLTFIVCAELSEWEKKIFEGQKVNFRRILSE